MKLTNGFLMFMLSSALLLTSLASPAGTFYAAFGHHYVSDAPYGGYGPQTPRPRGVHLCRPNFPTLQLRTPFVWEGIKPEENISIAATTIPTPDCTEPGRHRTNRFCAGDHDGYINQQFSENVGGFVGLTKPRIMTDSNMSVCTSKLCGSISNKLPGYSDTQSIKSTNVCTCIYDHVLNHLKNSQRSLRLSSELDRAAIRFTYLQDALPQLAAYQLLGDTALAYYHYYANAVDDNCSCKCHHQAHATITIRQRQMIETCASSTFVSRPCSEQHSNWPLNIFKGVILACLCLIASLIPRPALAKPCVLLPPL